MLVTTRIEKPAGAGGLQSHMFRAAVRIRAAQALDLYIGERT